MKNVKWLLINVKLILETNKRIMKNDELFQRKLVFSRDDFIQILSTFLVFILEKWGAQVDDFTGIYID